MRITEALKILHASDKASSPFRVALSCGFTPLHLSTFLGAHLQQRLLNRRVEVSSGLYGDLAGTLETLGRESVDAVAVAVEWSDLDPRLGYRSAGRWGVAALGDVLSQVPRSLERLCTALEHIPAGIPVALSTPTLALPPVFHTIGSQAGEAELVLENMITEFALRVQRRTGIQIVNMRLLAEQSAPGERFDLKSDLVTGLPYSVSHADILAETVARLLTPAPPKKGVITDLDDTLWSGLVGEVGPAAVSWDLASHKALHGLYQKLLATLAEEGVLVGVASKNDPAVVAKAFERDDILIPAASIFPMEVHWNAKSGSVARILKRWNISADSVVFVDDSPLELAEVAAEHTGIECVQFPGKDYGTSGYQMLRRIRDLFGKPQLSQEDSLRLNSIRSAVQFEEATNNQSSSEDFLQQLDAVVSFDFPEGLPDARVLELVNKTNQFNLNGIRYSEAEWAKRLLRSNSVLGVVSYQDKFGPLGKIAVVQGAQAGRSLKIDVWVLSCRAFARRIEQQCLRMLFDRYEVDAIDFSFARTAKNGPLTEFVTSILGSEPAANFVLTREAFDSYCPPLYHTVKDNRRVEVNG